MKTFTYIALLIVMTAGLSGCVATPPPGGVTAAYRDATALQSALDEADRDIALTARQTALERLGRGQTHRWSSRATGAMGSVTPIRTWTSAAGGKCRDFREAVETPAGHSQELLGSACRDDSGQWRIVAGEGAA